MCFVGWWRLDTVVVGWWGVTAPVVAWGPVLGLMCGHAMCVALVTAGHQGLSQSGGPCTQCLAAAIAGLAFVARAAHPRNGISSRRSVAVCWQSCR